MNKMKFLSTAYYTYFLLLRGVYFIFDYNYIVIPNTGIYYVYVSIRSMNTGTDLLSLRHEM